VVFQSFRAQAGEYPELPSATKTQSASFADTLRPKLAYEILNVLPQHLGLLKGSKVASLFAV